MLIQLAQSRTRWPTLIQIYAKGNTVTLPVSTLLNLNDHIKREIHVGMQWWWCTALICFRRTVVVWEHNIHDMYTLRCHSRNLVKWRKHRDFPPLRLISLPGISIIINFRSWNTSNLFNPVYRMKMVFVMETMMMLRVTILVQESSSNLMTS